MPYVNLKISNDTPIKKYELLEKICTTVSNITGKARKYIMVSVETADFLFQDTNDHAAFVDIKGIGGINPAGNKKLSEAICKLLAESAGILPERIYINFTDVEASNWGWNSSTFGG